MLTVALATVRGRWATFAGTFATLALGVSVIATIALVLAAASGGGPHQSPERFAAAPYVIQVDPYLRVHDRFGLSDQIQLLAQPGVPASVTARLPGTISDRSFHAQVEGAPVSAGTALGHGWSSARFAPYVLTSGHAPSSDDEIVVAGTAVLGSRVPVVTATGTRTYTIAGTVRPRTGEQPIFFTDAEAARLSRGPDAVDALVTSSAATAARASALPRPHLRVLTGASRHQADPGAMQDATELSGFASFLSIAAMVSGFVAIAVTATAFGMSVAQRRRDLALLRTVGATPNQVMRGICTEAALVGAAGSAAGCLLSLAEAPLLAHWIVGQGLVPPWFMVPVTAGSAPVLVIAFVAGVAVAVLSVLLAAARAARIRPAAALREAAVEPKRVGCVRLASGLLGILGGVIALAALARLFPSALTDPKIEAGLCLLLIGGTSMLSPFLLGPLTRPFGRGTAGMLLRANILAATRRSAAVVMPVLITAGLTTSILGAGDTVSATASAAQRQQAADADFVVLPAAGVPGLTRALLNRIHDIRGAEATAVADTNMLADQPQITSYNWQAPFPIPFPAIAIDRPTAALNLKVIAGSLAGLDDHAIAVDPSWHKHVGEAMNLWRPDGTRLSLRVIAVTSSSLAGPSLIVNLHNAGVAMPDRAYVKTDSGAARAALLTAARSDQARVVPASRWSAAVSNQQAQQNQAGLELLLGIAVAYSLIGVASTFAMSVSGRRPEQELLRRTGATRRQIIWFIVAESLALTLIGILLSAVIAGLTLGAVYAALRGIVEQVSLVVPWPLIAAVIAASVAIAVLASILPIWFQARPRASHTTTNT